jgi:hypothetical protein
MNSHDRGLAPSGAEIAALLARLRELTSRAATEAERAAFRADKDALLARLPDRGRPPDTTEPADATDAADAAEVAQRSPDSDRGLGETGDAAHSADRVDLAGEPAGGWHTVSGAQAAHQLAERGADLDTARAMVADYLRDTSDAVGVPADAWGLDQADIDAIATAHQLPAAAAAAEQDVADTDRAAQLSRWHTDDQTSPADTDAAEAGAGFADGDADGSADGAGWSR